MSQESPYIPKCLILVNSEDNHVEESHICENPINQNMITFDSERARYEAERGICQPSCQLYNLCDPTKRKVFNRNGAGRVLVANSEEKIPREDMEKIYPAYTSF